MWGYAGNKSQQQGTSGGFRAGDRASFNWSDVMKVGPGKVSDVMNVGSSKVADVMRVGSSRNADVIKIRTNTFGYTCPFPVSTAGASRSTESEKGVVIVGAKPGAGAVSHITRSQISGSQGARVEAQGARVGAQTGSQGARVEAQTGSLGTEVVPGSIGTGRSEENGGVLLSNPIVSQGQELFKQGNKRQRTTE